MAGINFCAGRITTSPAIIIAANWTGILYRPSFSRLRESTLLPVFSICCVAQTATCCRKWQTPCYGGKLAAGNYPPPKAALIYAAFCGATHSRIFPSCFARWFALRANSKNAAIIAYAIMTAPKARLARREWIDGAACAGMTIAGRYKFPPQ